MKRLAHVVARSRRIATASADKTVKIWDTVAGTVLHTIAMADKPAVEDMQVRRTLPCRSAAALVRRG